MKSSAIPGAVAGRIGSIRLARQKFARRAWSITICSGALAMALAAGGRADAAITDNLRLYLPFNTSAADLSGNAVPMTNVNGVTFGGAGVVGNAAVLNNSAGVTTATAQYIHTTSELALGVSDFTVALWVNGSSPITVNQTDGALVSNKDWNSGGNTGYAVARGTAGGGGGWQWNFRAAGKTRRDFDPAPLTSQIENSQWHHVAVSHDRDGLASFYYDGQLIGTNDISASVGATIDAGLPTAFGTDGALGTPWDAFLNGMLDDAAIWNRAVAGVEIAAIYQNGLLGTALVNVTAPEVLTMAVNRANGQIVLRNNSFASVDVQGYSIESAGGALAPASWTSITDGGDSNSGGSIDNDDLWVEFTDPNAHGDLSEGSLNEGTFTAGETFSLGVGAWIKYWDEDLTFKYINGSGQVVDGLIEFTGNSGNPYAFGDLNFDSAVNGQDWLTYVGGLGKSLTGKSIAEAYRDGDMNGDLLNNNADFLEFRTAYDAVNGLGSFEAMIARVPEPATMALAVFGFAGVMGGTRRRR